MLILPSFLGTRADALTEVVFLAILLILPLMGWSVWLARKQQFPQHRIIQTGLTLLLTVVVALFESNIQAQGGIYDMARESTYVASPWFSRLFAVHLAFASTTGTVWLALVATSLWKIRNFTTPNTFRRFHRIAGWLGVVGMTGTGLTGGIFFILAFWGSGV